MFEDSSNDEMGQCDCGFIYNLGSRFDHDADTGQCWCCSDRNIFSMDYDQLMEYLNG